MAITEIKKYLDQQGVSVLWGEVAKKLNDEKVRAEAAEKAASDAAAAAQAAADAAQGEVDSLETYVGTFTHDSAKSVVEYIDAKVTSASGEANSALEALGNRVTVNEGDIATIKGDYLKAADKTELQGKIDLKADASALEAEIARAKAAEEKNAADIALILDNPDTEAKDSIKEFITYIAEHGEVATGLQTQITTNKDDIAAMDTAYKAADSAIIARLEAVETELGDGEGSVTEQIEAAKQAAISAAAADATTKANNAQAAAEATAKDYTDAEVAKIDAKAVQNATDLSALTGRVSTLETNDGDKETRIAAMEAKVASWDAAEANAKAHAEAQAAAALASAKEYSDANLVTAKAYSDANLVVAKTYTETAYANIQALSEAEIKAAINSVTQA